VHEDLFKDIDRVSQTHYASDYDLHIDLSRTIKRLNDGHCMWINACYVCALFSSNRLDFGLIQAQGL
jgi:hypothetical protein